LKSVHLLVNITRLYHNARYNKYKITHARSSVSGLRISGFVFFRNIIALEHELSRLSFRVPLVILSKAPSPHSKNKDIWNVFLRLCTL